MAGPLPLLTHERGVKARLLRLLCCLTLLATVSHGRETARAGGIGSVSLDGISLLVQTGNAQLDQAERYALAVLGADYSDPAHAAAVNYYSNPWIRDSFAWGMAPTLLDASVDSYSSAELRYWLDRQQPFGGWLTAAKSGYFDETPILISAVLSSYQVTGDLRLVQAALPRMERGWQWLSGGFIKPAHGSRYLIWANVPPHVAADWVDQIGRHGYATQLEALWYWATRSLGIMERLTGHGAAADRYGSFASNIRSDINRLLWTTDAPFAFNAPPVAPFGHYRSWVGRHDYFEMDSNFLCIVYGIASPDQGRSITGFVRRQEKLVLGLGTPGVVPAKVVYGDYAPADYARKHERLAPGKYQNGFWPTVGALAAMGFAAAGDPTEARLILQSLAAGIVRGSDVREWYTPTGAGEGAPAFQWAARMFVVALYSAFLGVREYADDQGIRVDAGIRLSVPAGPGTGDLAFHGRIIRFSVEGSGQGLRLARNGRHRAGSTLPGPSLCAGCAFTAVWG